MNQSKEINIQLTEQLERIPEAPGVYQYFDQEGLIIYVGKAKNLKKRVLSYFRSEHTDSPKTRLLVKKIKDIKFIVVDNEEDALLLENNLIKEYRPRYNILLKDDKTYPSICIKKERFPRVFQTRNILKDGSEYFGPYSSISMVRAILQMIRKIYPIRTCKLPMLKEDIAKGKYKTCLEYQIKKCMGPCVGLQMEADYLKNIDEIREILKGNTQNISNFLKAEMNVLAEKMKFEEAHQIKQKYDLIEQYKSKSTVVNSTLDDVEVYSYEDTEQSAIVNHLYLVNGCIVRGITLEYKKKVEEEKESILSSAIFEIRQRFASFCKEIITPFIPDIQLIGVKYNVPVRGDRKKVLDLSFNNAKQYKIDLLKQQEKLNPEQRSTRILGTLKKDLNLKEMPLYIECFDNSNIQGSFPVSSCVVFKNAKPSKKDYRNFNVKSVEGPDDFASMEEVIFRRFERLKKEQLPLPNLIIVDGGKGQLSSAVTALKKVGIYDLVTVIGIAKNLEEIFFPNDPIPLYLDKNSESLKLIQQLRDETHRFGITHHRQKRSKAQTHSIIDEIAGIGESTKSILIKTFKSVKRIQEASKEDLVKCIGKSKGEKVFTYFKEQE